jgi:hypothetical protein
MKMKTLILILLFSTVMFSSPSYAEWTKADKNESGEVFYVDYERMRKHDGYVYYWSLMEYLKPTSTGELSVKFYSQGDCKLFRYKKLSFSYHNEPMGGGTGGVDNNPDKEWNYPTPNSSAESILKQVCAYAK